MDCCKNPAIQSMDYKWPLFDEVQVVKVNRVCLRCFAHWASQPDESVKQYTRQEWDKYVEDGVES